ncbi:DUF4190 domain-containing protein [Streptomyces sulphureus]|uniref:DUF4190 domain-containing protein n=1 Tax=Streptomyces sulphureus TaxID=47758 RepID=UPI00037D1033|nr:DUF4190 domain-containing protein [Streptomyces sulphureus]
MADQGGIPGGAGKGEDAGAQPWPAPQDALPGPSPYAPYPRMGPYAQEGPYAQAAPYPQAAPSPYGPQYAANQPPYAPGYGWGPPLPNGQAVAAMVLGILGLFTVPLVLSVIAVCLGTVARTKADRGVAAGRSMAVTGLVTGWVGLIGFALVLLLVAVVVG